ncbi:MAG: hypothetical protein Q4C20_03960 [Erysipelotrichaceae bacterium]|nr:hypothetical protein [Erysipelotrichaceae bacterium]
MQIFINIFFMAASWAAGVFVFTIASEKIKNYRKNRNTADLLYAIGLFAAVIVTVVLAAVLNNTQGAACMAGGYVVSFINIIDPIKLTQAKADEIGRKAAAEAAAKEKREEEKREAERIKAENARIYNEEKKKAASK